MKKPNFFILGAPKCGTTSLAAWLSEHPQVFISSVKEPLFFNFDYGQRRYYSLASYEKLFWGATEKHIAVGEASTGYLYSRTAVPAILNYADNARFIVMVRNPATMAHARHEQLVFDGDEPEKDFDRAWDLQAVRRYGAETPAGVDPQMLLYGDICRVGAQLARLFELVPQERVLIVRLEDVISDPGREYNRVLIFLGLQGDQRDSFPAINAAKERRFPRLWQSIRWVNRTLRAIGVPQIRLGLTAFVYHRSRKERSRHPMSEATRKRLDAYFADDVRLLEQLIGRNPTEQRSKHA